MTFRKAFGRKSKAKAEPEAPAIAPIPLTPVDGEPDVDAFAAAVASQNWDAARATYAEIPAWWARARCISSVDLDDRTFAALGSWIDQTAGQDPLPYLIRGAGGVGWAWDARGSGWSDTVTQEGWALFFDRLRTADQDLHRAARLDLQDPNPWISLLPAAMGLQIPQAERDLRFEQAFRRDPSNLAAHLSYVQCVAGKWSGDDERMWRFAKDVHAGVPAGSPLRVVVASAFEELVFSNGRSEGEPPHDLAAAGQVVVEAIEMSVLHPDFAQHEWHQQSIALTKFLVTLIESPIEGAIPLGARLIPLLRNSPDREALGCINGPTDAHRWAILCNYFAHAAPPEALAA